MTFFNGSLEVHNHAHLGWRWPHYYRPTVLHRHGFLLGPLTVWWGKDYAPYRCGVPQPSRSTSNPAGTPKKIRRMPRP